MASLVRHVTSAGSPSLLGEGPARFLVQGSPCALAALSSRGWGKSPEECLAGPQSVPKALEATGWPARPADTQEMENFARLGCSHSKAREGLTAGPALPPPAGGRVSHRWDETGESQPGSWEPEEAGGGEATGRRDGSFWSWVWAESWAFGRSPWLELRRAGPGVGGTWAAGVRCGRAAVGCTASLAWLLVFLPRSAARVPTSRAVCRPPRGRGAAESRPAGPRAAVLSAGSAPRPRNPCRVAWAVLRLGLRAAERGPSRPRHRTHGHGPSAGSTPSFCPQHAPPFLFIVKIRSSKKIGTGQKTVKKETTVPFALSASASRRTRPRRCLRRGACGARSPSFPRGGGPRVHSAHSRSVDVTVS